MRTPKRPIKFTIAETTRYIFAEVIIVPALAWLAAGGGILVGSLRGIDAFYIYCAAIILFAYAVWLANWLSAWRLRNNVADKIFFAQGRVALQVTQAGVTEGIGLGFDLHSVAEYPLEFTVDELRPQIDDRTLPVPHTRTQPFTLPPGGRGFYDSPVMSVDAPQSQTVVGYLDATVTFARGPRRTRHELRIAKRILLTFDASGALTNATWYDAPTP